MKNGWQKLIAGRFYSKYFITVFQSPTHLRRGLPFELTLLQAKPTAIGGMSREKLDGELQKGMASLKAGKRISADEVDRELAEEFGL